MVKETHVTLSLPKGMKQTEIGLIPEDWEMKSLSEFAAVLTGTTPPTNNRKNYGDEYFFVSPADLGKTKFIENTEKKLSKSGYSIARKYPPNSILFTCIGSTIGKSGIAKFELSSNQQINAVLPNSFFSSDYVYYFLNLVSAKIKLGASEQAVPMINKTEFSKIQIPLPPLAEQEAIAAALSDCDTWIESLEQIIAKKRLIKQGAMQELLTPKKDWEVKKLGEMTNLITKGTTPTSVGFDFTESGVNFIKVESLTKIGTIDNEKVAFINERCNEVLSRSQIMAGDILFSIAGALGRVAIVKRNIIPANTNQALGIIRLKENTINKEFLYFFFNTNEFQRMLNTISVTGAQPNLSLQNLNEFEIIFPSLSEQTRIATVLSDMDAELEALGQKINKARQIKQGMMQELLTGRVRLV